MIQNESLLPACYSIYYLHHVPVVSALNYLFIVIQFNYRYITGFCQRTFSFLTPPSVAILERRTAAISAASISDGVGMVRLRRNVSFLRAPTSCEQEIEALSSRFKETM